MRFITLVLAVCALFLSNSASSQIVGPTYQVNIGGLPLNCTSNANHPVAIYFNYQLNNVGVATRSYNGAPVIILNPNVINQYSNTVAQWWFAHECAHHALPPQWNSESNADCFAVRELVRYGIISHQQQLVAFQQELASLPGSPMGHLPGPVRIQHIINCALR